MIQVKQILGVLALGALVFVGYWAWQGDMGDDGPSAPKAKGGASRAFTVEVARASLRKIDTITEAVGTIRANRSVHVTPLSSGRVVEIGFEAGGEVEEGAVLLRLDSELQRTNLAEAEAKLKEARSALKRSVILKKSSAVSEASVDRLVAATEIAEAERDRAAKQLRDRVVYAPFAGRIGFSTVERGAHVKEGEEIAVLDDLSTVDVEFSVPEGLFGQIKIGDVVHARAAPFPDRVFSGTISAIDNRIDNVSRAFKVRGLIANDDKALPAGMFVHVSIVLDGSDALAVPEEAVIADGSRAFVFAVIEGEAGDKKAGHKVERRQVSLGRRTYGFVEIKDGLKLGEAVVIRGIQKVRDGAVVQFATGQKAKTAEDSQKGDSDEPSD